MAQFKKAPVPQPEPEPASGGGLPGVDPEIVAQVTDAAFLYWPTALGVVVVVFLLLKGLRRLAPVAAFAAAVMQGILLEVFW